MISKPMEGKWQPEEKNRDEQPELNPKEIEIIQETNQNLNQTKQKPHTSLERHENWCIHKSNIRCQENDNSMNNKEFLEIKALITENFGK